MTDRQEQQEQEVPTPRENGLQLHDPTADPEDGYEPVPLWLIAMFGGLLAWGGWYLGTYSAGFRWYELDEKALYKAQPATQAEEDPIALGKRIFQGNCVSCHQASGEGVPGQYPTLHASEWVLGNPAWMKRIVLNGLEGPIEVKGQRYNSAMPPFGAKFNDKQIAAVINYVRTNQDWQNSAEPVTPESVAATRDATKGRSVPWTASELLAITTDEAPAAQTEPAATQAAPAQNPQN